MATVTMPNGDVEENVTGQLLTYYRGEGYVITDEEEDQGPVFPVHFPPVDGEQGDLIGDQVDLTGDVGDGDLAHCPEPGCDATLAAAGEIVAHHEDGSHTFVPVGEPPVEIPAESDPLDLH